MRKRWKVIGVLINNENDELSFCVERWSFWGDWGREKKNGKCLLRVFKRKYWFNEKIGGKRKIDNIVEGKDWESNKMEGKCLNLVEVSWRLIDIYILFLILILCFEGKYLGV